MDKKTKMTSAKTKLALSNITAIILILLIIGAVIVGITKAQEFTQLKNYQEVPPAAFTIYFIVAGGIFLLFPLSALFRINKSVKKAKSTTLDENKLIDANKAFQYYRELPNNYGIGVNTLLTDSTLENYKDIVAVILDLCARKYLKLIKQNNSYVLQVLKGIDDRLLSNEKYILSLIINDNIKNIDYQEWFNYCYSDGKELGLFSQNIVEHRKHKTPLDGEEVAKGFKKIAKISLIISLFCILNPLIALGVFITLFTLMSIIYYFSIIIKGLSNVTKMSADIAYDMEMRNQLIRSEKGKQELEKVFAFKAFIKDFSRFAEKHVDEIYLWDRYLSYAQVFGLTNEIMRSGYKELVNNSSFIIDDINNITLDNIVKEN